MKTSPTEFSLIVTCYDSEKFVRESLESIHAQDYEHDQFEVICVDDGSRDQTADIIQEFKSRFPYIVYLKTIHQGLEKACNEGVRQAKFPWIVRVDSDDMIKANFLTRMNKAIQETAGMSFYYCKQYMEYYFKENQIAKELPEFDPEEIFSRGDFFATGTVYRKSDLFEIGLFPENVVNCGLENYSVILSLIVHQKKGVAVSGTGFCYRRHSTNMSTLRRTAIIEYGKQLLVSYHRSFQTNQYHPYGLII